MVLSSTGYAPSNPPAAMTLNIDTTSRRPRHSCANCARGGVLPGALKLVDGRYLCSAECGWSYVLSPSESRIDTRIAPREAVAPEVELKLIRQDLAHAERVQMLLARRLRRDPRYQAAMACCPAAPPPNPAPPPHPNFMAAAAACAAPESHALFAFTALLGHD